MIRSSLARVIATYHKIRDVIHVQHMLGHKDIKSTMIYINLEQALFNASNDAFHVPRKDSQNC